QDTLDGPCFSVPTVKDYCVSAIIGPKGRGEDSISIHLIFGEAQMKLDKIRHNTSLSSIRVETE
ncbi:hypothetical protein AJ78_07590, partial [Emergomyces pasteurianus Ep9510]